MGDNMLDALTNGQHSKTLKETEAVRSQIRLLMPYASSASQHHKHSCEAVKSRLTRVREEWWRCIICQSVSLFVGVCFV